MTEMEFPVTTSSNNTVVAQTVQQPIVQTVQTAAVASQGQVCSDRPTFYIIIHIIPIIFYII